MFEQSLQPFYQAVHVARRVVGGDGDADEVLAIPIAEWYLDLILIPEAAFDLVHLLDAGQWQRYGAHLRPPVWRIGRNLRHIGERGDALTGFGGERVALGADARPIMLPLEGDSGGRAEIRGGIMRANPAEVVLEVVAAGVTRLPSPTDDQWL